jgi:hypothetical protein
MIQSIFGKVFRHHFEDHFTVWYLSRNTHNMLGSIFRRNFVHFSVVFKGFVFAKYVSCPIDSGSSRSCHNSEMIFIWWWILIAWCWSRTCGFKVGTCWQVLLTGKCFVTTFVIFGISKWSIFDSCIFVNKFSVNCIIPFIHGRNKSWPSLSSWNTKPFCRKYLTNDTTLSIDGRSALIRRWRR